MQTSPLRPAAVFGVLTKLKRGSVKMTTMKTLEDIVAQLGVTMVETRKEWKESLAESQKKWEESQKEREESQKKWEESQKKREESWERTERALDRMSAEHEKSERLMQRLEKNMGGLNNSIGEIVEMIVIPGVKEKMNAFRHTFTMASPRKEYSDTDGSTLTEVDLLLENCDEVMVVEVKTQVSKKWVERHLKRLEILRKKERITGMTGKTMYAAVAGIGFDEEARELAADNGMYLIDINEDTERIDVKAPDKVGTW
jgi:predicted nuclease with TOPRIM domain